MSDLGKRKTDHIELALNADVAFRRTTLFDQVELVHRALPEVSFDDLDTSTNWFGKKTRSPLLIAAMTGGNERAREINLRLAEVAERGGYAMGLGSQRAMVKTGSIDPRVLPSYQLRAVAPSIPILGNVGVVQAGQMSRDLLEEMVGSVGADALCVHLNPAQEMIQPEGDRDFRGNEETLARLASELSVPVVVKETGAGISRFVARRLRALGVRHVDVSGAGGTSWVAVETHRARDELEQRGRLFWDWGIPTAASLLEVEASAFETVIATGGIRHGLDVARAIALGAHGTGIARLVLQKLEGGGVDGALAFLGRTERELRTAMLLTGSRRLDDLRRAPRLLGPDLARWRDYAAE